ncbi:MAG TPA: metallophosphoesterase [Pyrinomonadaceae bacterium]|nr:metallophosphoesterase [Pyrinomonadaceae bacterium]
MEVRFQNLPHDDALSFAREYMGFTAEFAFRLARQMAADTETYLADLGALTVGTELTFSIEGANAKDQVSLQDSPETPVVGRDLNRPNVFRLMAAGDGVIALTRNPASVQQWTVQVQSVKKHKRKFQTDQKLTFVFDKPQKPSTSERIFIWRFRVIDPAPMVGWYDPGQLLHTAGGVLTSQMFGRNADYRLMEALAPGTDEHYDYTGDFKTVCHDDEKPVVHEASREEIWLDYVGDVGDGWDSTYTLAYLIAQPHLELENPHEPECPHLTTRRADVLIFGGDQVYPTASRAEYHRRLLQPYQTALYRSPDNHPHVYAIPGNHDWYDSLVSFSRLFCQKRWFAGWQTQQQRSYFALRLPGRWWLLGTDVQLDSDIDVPQINYFREVAKHMEPGDQVIICTAEPHWVYAKLYGKDDANFNENNLAYLEKKIIGDRARVVAFIAGDQHHYRRYESADRIQKITAGGGGAFLHPTHGEEVNQLDGGFTLKANYPLPGDSKKLGWSNFKFPALNPWFGLLTGVLYVLTAWTVMADVGGFGKRRILDAIKTTLATAMISPGAIFWMLAIFVGFLLFTDTHSKRYKRIAGPVHGLIHLLATFVIGWTAAYISVSQLHPWLGHWIRFSFQSPGQLVFSAIFIFFFGWLIGSLIVGTYLFVSLNIFGRHSNEAFSSLAIPDWKNFLRIRISANGDLTVFPIGIPKVPRAWRKRAHDEIPGSDFDAADVSIRVPKLIEPPITIKRPPTEAAPIPVESESCS